MAFCTQCGAVLPESGKFCPGCGAPMEAALSAQVPAVSETAPETPLFVPVPMPLPEGKHTPAGKKPRTLGMLFALAAFALSLCALLSSSLVLSIVFSLAAIAAGVLAFVKKGRLKAFTVIAFFIAAFALVDTVWYIATGKIILAPSGTDTVSVQTKQVAERGVDPELAKFLDSYESFVDDYIAFMQTYASDPSNVISMLSDYLEMAEKLEDFSELADRYDPEHMSAADAEYYLTVMTRCESKLLRAIQ